MIKIPSDSGKIFAHAEKKLQILLYLAGIDSVLISINSIPASRRTPNISELSNNVLSNVLNLETKLWNFETYLDHWQITTVPADHETYLALKYGIVA